MDGIFFKLKDIRKPDPYKEESVLSRRLNSTIENGRFIAVRKSGDRYAPFYRKVARAVTRGVFRASICDDEIFRSVFRICVSFLRCFASFQPRYSPRNGMQFPRRSVLLPRGSNNPRESTICAISNFLIETNFPPAVSISLIFIINRILGNLERNSYSRG